MASWSEFETAAPALSALCYQRFKSTDLVMLGTLRKDGFPRISPIEWALYQGELALGGMWHAKRALDLLRDPRCTIHSTTWDKDGKQGDAKLWGRAKHMEGHRLEEYWLWVLEQFGWRPTRGHVFTIDIDSAAYVTFTGDGRMKRLQWPGNAEWVVTRHG